MRMLAQVPMLLPSTINSLYFPYRGKVLPIVPDVSLMACFISTNHGTRFVFRQKLESCCTHGGQVLRSDITLNAIWHELF